MEWESPLFNAHDMEEQADSYLHAIKEWAIPLPLDVGNAYASFRRNKWYTYLQLYVSIFPYKIILHQ